LWVGKRPIAVYEIWLLSRQRHALVRTRVCPGTQFSQVNSHKIRNLDIFSRPKTAGFRVVVFAQTFSPFRRRAF